MDNLEIRQEILDACKFLQEKGLIARTWGNVSARISDDEFIITPSGLAYEQTNLEDLCIVKIADCSYDESQRKPSSEKKVHAACYKARKDVKYIVHTHQHFASAICAEEEDVYLSDKSFVPCAKYGLSGTDKLRDNCYEVFLNYPDSQMFLMAKHGTVTVGETMKQALDEAIFLEKECQKLFEERVKDFYIPKKMKPYLDDYAQMFPLKDLDDPEAAKMVASKNAAAMLYCKKAKPINLFTHILEHSVYLMKYSKLKDKK